MKNQLISLTLTLCLSGRAEVFFGPSNETNRLIIPENAAITISAVLADPAACACNSPVVTGIYALSQDAGQIRFSANTGSLRLALAGPAEVIINSPGAVSYKVLHNTPIRSIIAAPGSTNLVEVPEGKTVKFFNPINAGPSAGSSMSTPGVNVSLLKGERTLKARIVGGEELSGPIILDFSASQFQMDSAIISYYFTEDFAVMPDLGLLLGPTGAFEVLVEKSVDLQSWFPVIAHLTGSDQKAFYRVRMNK